MAKPSTQTDLLELGRKLLSSGPHKTCKTPKRIRILFNGVYVVDSTTALYVWEHPYYPYYYVPLSSFAHGVLRDERPSDGPLSIKKIEVGGKSTDRVLVVGENVTGELAGMVRVEFGAADAWFEEDERIYVHPKDPFKRVEILHSTRPIRVLIDGVQVAHAVSSQHLHETGLPVRYYLPATAVDPAVLINSNTSSQCPYKGVASYYHVALNHEWGGGTMFKDIVWYYRTPTHESAQVAGHLCFYNERVDIELDGKMLERPKANSA